uniref:Uncharacterized protein n=1 Tax=Oryza glumipatula TaxID=40148 RepID=A0A0D9YA62_9ORYZ
MHILTEELDKIVGGSTPSSTKSGLHEDVSHLNVAELKESVLETESEASHLNITPRRLPFTIINNVAHYGPNEVPMSCVTQTTTLNMNTSDFVVHNSGNDQNECDHDDDISLAKV